MDFEGAFKALLDQLDLRFWSRNSRLRLLLKSMENVDSARKSYGINRSKCIATMIGDNLKNAGANVPHRFCRCMLTAQLRLIKSNAYFASNRIWKALHPLPGVAYPNQRLGDEFGRIVHVD